MKTLIIYNEIVSCLKYAIVDGDYSHFHGVMVNAVDGNGNEVEFCEFMFNEEGRFKIELSEDKSLVENKQWDKVAIVTFLP